MPTEADLDAAGAEPDAAAPTDGPLDRITVQAGAGIVADSDPTAEYEETESKMDGTLAALERIEDEAQQGDGDTAEQADAAAESPAQGGADGDGPATDESSDPTSDDAPGQEVSR